MTTMSCYHCGAETSNGLALCDLSQMAASKALEFLPIYFRNLARWRPGRAGSRPVPGSRVLYDGETRTGSNDRVIRALEDAGNDLSTWARCLADDRGVELPDCDSEVDQVSAVCRLLAGNLTSIATLEWCGEFVRKMARHEERLRLLTEDVAPGWYAGGCRRCDSGTYVVPGLTWVTCGGCGSTTYARDHLETVLDEARGWVAPPMRLAEAVVALVDAELSVPRLHKRISKWGEREQVEVLRRFDAEGDAFGPKHYRLGDVLDRLQAEGATRIDAIAVRVS